MPATALPSAHLTPATAPVTTPPPGRRFPWRIASRLQAGRSAPSLVALALALGIHGVARAQDAAPASAEDPALYSLELSHTAVHWEVLHMGTSTSRGRFDRLGGSVRYDPSRAFIDVSIEVDTGSVSTGLPAFDAVLRGASLLATGEHPTAWFVARRATWEGPVPRQLHGELTVRGTSVPLTLRAVRWKCGLNLLFRREVCGGDFEAVLRRSELGMTLAAGFVADEVTLRVQVEAVKGRLPG
jgi:polyisoprenoid-binding protein YceI